MSLSDSSDCNEQDDGKDDADADKDDGNNDLELLGGELRGAVTGPTTRATTTTTGHINRSKSSLCLTAMDI